MAAQVVKEPVVKFARLVGTLRVVFGEAGHAFRPVISLNENPFFGFPAEDEDSV